MEERVDFGELRSLLDGMKTAEQFERLIALIEAGVEKFGRAMVEEQWLPYALEKLASWPADKRRCRRDMLRRLEQEDDLCWGPLVKTLDYELSPLTARRVKEIAQASHLANITHLDLTAASVNWYDLNELAQTAPFRLESFALRKSTSSGAKEKDLAPLFASPMLSDLRELALPGWSRFGASSMKVMLATLPLAKLERLDLHATGIGKSGLISLLKCKRFASLRELHLGGLEFHHDKVLRAFEEVEGFESVRELSLFHTKFKPSKLRPASELPFWTKLESLDLTGNTFDAADVAWLCDADDYPNLKTLSFSSVQWEREALKELLGATCFEQVESLRLSDADLEAEYFEEVSWRGLRELDLMSSSFDVSCWRAMARCDFWRGLTRLGLANVITPWLAARPQRGNLITRISYVERVQELISEIWKEASLPPELESLDLRGCGIDEHLMAMLLEQECMETLQQLDMSGFATGQGVNAGALKMLSEADKCPQLTTLGVESEESILEAVAAFAQSKSARSLREIHVCVDYPEDEFSKELAAMVPEGVRVLEV